MGEFQLMISIPVEVNDLGDLTAKELVDLFDAANKAKKLETELESKRMAVNQFGLALELILDSDLNDFTKAKSLRSLAEEMKKWNEKTR